MTLLLASAKACRGEKEGIEQEGQPMDVEKLQQVANHSRPGC